MSLLPRDRITQTVVLLQAFVVCPVACSDLALPLGYIQH